MINKERFKVLATNTAHSMEGGFNWNSGTAIVSEGDVVRYAVALIKAVEQEAEVVGCVDGHEQITWTTHESMSGRELIALPLVSEE